MRLKFRAKFLANLTAVALGAFIVQATCAHGVPLLRHDWAIPVAPKALGPAVGVLFQPWILRGIGDAQPYPTAYVIGFVLAPLSVLPPAAFTSILVFAIGTAIAFAASEVARSLRSNAAGQIACAFVGALNPWSYTEFVAGHIFMLLAYAFVLLLCAEILRDRPRMPLLVLLCGLLISQIEFFAFALIPLVFWLAKTRRYVALCAVLVGALPVAFGIVSHYADVRGTPYLLDWQISQSIEFFGAVVLRGYFAHYDGGFGAVQLVLLALVACAAVATMISLAERTRSAVPLVMGWLGVVLATGTKWWIGPAYRYVVLHIPESGLFRELYDLLAFTCIAYVVAVAVLASRYHRFALPLCAFCALLVVPWVATPPNQWFVPASAVPAKTFRGTPDERVALFPPVQPLRLRNPTRGSGYDPDLFVQRGAAVPLNTSFPSFPEISALAQAGNGNFSALDSLGVRYVLSRDYLEEDFEALKFQLPSPNKVLQRPSQTRTIAYPVLGLIPGDPQLAGIARSTERNGIFFGDTHTSPYWYNPVVPSNDSADPRISWIDARLAFYKYPQIATRFGGAFTESSAAKLAIPSGPYALAWTSGRLVDDRMRLVLRASPRLTWSKLPSDARLMQCFGSCAVVAVGDPPPIAPEGRLQHPVAVRFATITPWLVRATIPAHGRSTLRWASRFEPSWTLLKLPNADHVRIDQDLNGWLLDPGPACDCAIVNVSAAIQLLLEIIAFIAIFVLSALSLPRRDGGLHA